MGVGLLAGRALVRCVLLAEATGRLLCLLVDDKGERGVVVGNLFGFGHTVDLPTVGDSHTEAGKQRVAASIHGTNRP